MLHIRSGGGRGEEGGVMHWLSLHWLSLYCSAQAQSEFKPHSSSSSVP